MTLDHLQRIADRLDHAIILQRDAVVHARAARIQALCDASDFASLLIAAQDGRTAIDGAISATRDLLNARSDVQDAIEQSVTVADPDRRVAA